MTQHALGSDRKRSDAPSHKDSRKRSRERRHSRGYGCVHWTEPELSEEGEEDGSDCKHLWNKRGRRGEEEKEGCHMYKDIQSSDGLFVGDKAAPVVVVVVVMVGAGILETNSLRGANIPLLKCL